MSKPYDNRPSSSTRTTMRGVRRQGSAIHPCLPAYLAIEQRAIGKPRRE